MRTFLRSDPGSPRAHAAERPSGRLCRLARRRLDSREERIASRVLRQPRWSRRRRSCGWALHLQRTNPTRACASDHFRRSTLARFVPSRWTAHPPGRADSLHEKKRGSTLQLILFDMTRLLSLFARSRAALRYSCSFLLWAIFRRQSEPAPGFPPQPLTQTTRQMKEAQLGPHGSRERPPTPASTVLAKTGTRSRDEKKEAGLSCARR